MVHHYPPKTPSMEQRDHENCNRSLLQDDAKCHRSISMALSSRESCLLPHMLILDLLLDCIIIEDNDIVRRNAPNVKTFVSQVIGWPLNGAGFVSWPGAASCPSLGGLPSRRHGNAWAQLKTWRSVCLIATSEAMRAPPTSTRCLSV